MKYLITAALIGIVLITNAQNAKPEDTEIWSPVPKVINPGKASVQLHPMR